MSAAGTSTVDRIIKYAAKGYKQAEIAAALGVDDSYVSQVVNDPDNAEKLEAQAIAFTEANDTYDRKIDEAEEMALEGVKRRLPMAKLGEQISALKVLNSMKRRRDTAPATRHNQTTVVQLQLPQIAQVAYLTNSSNEIVEVSGRTMVTATRDQLPTLMQAALGRTVEDPAVTEANRRKLERAQEVLDSLTTPVRPRSRHQLYDITDIS